MIGLSIISSHNLIQNSSSYLLKNNTNQSKKNLCKKIIFPLSIFFGLFSTIPRFYLTISYLKNKPLIEKIIFIPPSFLAPFAIGTVYVNKLLNRFKYLKNEKNILIEKLEYIKTIIKTMDDRELLSFGNDIYSDSEEITIEKIYEFSKMYDHYNNKTYKIHKYARNFFSYLGFFMGSLASYAYYQVVENALNSALNKINLKSKSVKSILMLVSLLIYFIPFTAVRGITTQNRMENFYEFLFLKNERLKVLKIKNIFILTEGIFAAIPYTYLAIKNSINKSWYIKLLIIPSFLSPFSMSTYSLNQLVNKIEKKIFKKTIFEYPSIKEEMFEFIDKSKIIIQNTSNDKILSIFNYMPDCDRI
ncbi:MAG: hypothetical protein A3F40_03905 [Chlamydiae bacterium RIFCSPHIGHO2_12_FULL_27_8]|nr:MAG: hypothetical protein A3F40_03905 [Chlamydiae bacterium RIFCSPHIGHO2_12_FULL_27_8]OGN65542.1 MAG: hypothetical protein A2888_00290 [Chlamydiae bacterium RIFCSPLOWO2_01_FULL_28_7]